MTYSRHILLLWTWVPYSHFDCVSLINKRDRNILHFTQKKNGKGIQGGVYGWPPPIGCFSQFPSSRILYHCLRQGFIFTWPFLRLFVRTHDGLGIIGEPFNSSASIPNIVVSEETCTPMENMVVCWRRIRSHRFTHKSDWFGKFEWNSFVVRNIFSCCDQK